MHLKIVRLNLLVLQRTVFAFTYGETVHQIAGDNDVSVEGLTESGSFKSMTLKDKNINEVYK